MSPSKPISPARRKYPWKCAPGRSTTWSSSSPSSPSLTLAQAVLAFGTQVTFTEQGPLVGLAAKPILPFIRDVGVLYIVLTIVVYLVVSSGLGIVHRLERWLSSLKARTSSSPANQKKRIFVASPPRRVSTNSAARNSPPAT